MLWRARTSRFNSELETLRLLDALIGGAMSSFISGTEGKPRVSL